MTDEDEKGTRRRRREVVVELVEAVRNGGGLDLFVVRGTGVHSTCTWYPWACIQQVQPRGPSTHTRAARKGGEGVQERKGRGDLAPGTRRRGNTWRLDKVLCISKGSCPPL